MAEHDLGPDLEELLAARGVPLASVTRVSTLSSPIWDRGAYCLRFADGTRLKGRRFENADARQRVARLMGICPASMMPAVVSARGRAMLTSWIDGTVLSSAAVTNADRHRAGEMLSSIHNTLLGDPPAWHPSDDPRTWKSTLDERLTRICDGHLLQSTEATNAAALAARHAPPSRHQGLVLGDLCPDNLVRDAEGQLWITDHDSLTVRAKEYDLARVTYRWPMTAAERGIFDAGYGDAPVLEAYRAHVVYWSIVVLVGASHFRLKHGLPLADVPMSRLRDLLVARGRR